MPSPFPGMDPYLEQPEFFPGLHDRIIGQLSDALQERLPRHYYAEIRSRVWVEFSGRGMTPDVNVLRSDEAAAPRPGSGAAAGGVAVAAPVVVAVPHDECREPFLELCTWQGGRHVVTAIEVLSLSNKKPGDHGRDLYLQKQRAVLRSQVHLVEIDLLRGGEHTTAVPLDRALARTGPFAYHVCVHRFDDLQNFYVYPVPLEQRLPAIPVPLLPGDGEVGIDLQAILDRCYDVGPYGRLPLYRETNPTPPLSPEQAGWATALLRQKGLLPPA
jgi:hypothetical protein